MDLTSTKYFNQPLFNYTLKFSSDSDCIFFAHSVIQKIDLSNQMSIATRKVISSQLKAGTPNSNFESVASDQAFTFMNSIKGTPVY